MKLSDIRGERVIDVIADIIDPIANIAQDKSCKAIFTAQRGKDPEKARKALSNRVKANLPKLIKTHRDDIVAILATINDVSQDEYRERMTLASVVADVLDLLNDEEFVGFLSTSLTTSDDGQHTERSGATVVPFEPETSSDTPRP